MLFNIEKQKHVVQLQNPMGNGLETQTHILVTQSKVHGPSAPVSDEVCYQFYPRTTGSDAPPSQVIHVLWSMKSTDLSDSPEKEVCAEPDELCLAIRASIWNPAMLCTGNQGILFVHYQGHLSAVHLQVKADI